MLFKELLDDVNNIKSQVIPANDHAVIIGGGYIGLETAASLRKQGMEVTVIEAMARVFYSGLRRQNYQTFINASILKRVSKFLKKR